MSGAVPNAALDVKNVMWLLATMAFVVAPHAFRLPEWVGAFIALVVGWRAWIAWRAARNPTRLLVLALTVGAVAATFFAWGRIVGRDAGTTLLVLMTAMKLLEMKTSREVVLAIHLGFVLVMTNFLFSQSIPLGIYMLACVWLFVATLVGYHRGVGRTPTVRERLVPSGLLLVQAVPLMLVFFVLFPRVQGPLGALPQDARAGLSGRKKDIFDKINLSIDKLSSTLEDLNKILRSRVHKTELREPVSFEKELTDVMHSISEEIMEKEAAITYDFSKAKDICYPGKVIHSVFLNTITNAIKYRKEHERPVIHITTQEDGEFVVLTITDNGKGIDMGKYGNKIFGVYQRFHENTEGKGLGLYIVKSQVEAIGGKIAVESMVNRGTAFQVFLKKNTMPYDA